MTGGSVSGSPSGPPPWRIEETSPAHAGVVAAIAGAALPPGPEAWTGDTVAQLLRDPTGRGWVILDGNAPVGMLLARQAGGEAEILSVAVLAPARRHGAGRALIEHALAALTGADTALLEVAADNPAAEALYRRCGFEPVGRRKGYYVRPNGTVDALVMRRDRA